MTTAATIAARLTLDKSDYDKGLGEGERQAQSFASKMTGVGKSMIGVGTLMTAGLTIPVVMGMKAVIGAASDLNEAQNAANVTFGEGAKIITDWGENAATQAGLAKSEFYQMGAVTGAMLQNFGFDQKKAAEETINLTKRAADMASIFNTNVPDALAAVQSALRGETEPIRRYGVSMSAATIEAKALSMGLGKTTVDMTKVNGIMLDAEKIQADYAKAVKKSGAESLEAREIAQKYKETEDKLTAALAGGKTELTQAEKAQAGLALFYQQTDRFAGDFVNTSDELANGTRILQAELKNESAALGKELLPYVLKAVRYFSDLLKQWQNMTPQQKHIIEGFVLFLAVIGPVVTVVGGIITTLGTVGTVITTVAGFISGVLVPAFAALSVAIGIPVLPLLVLIGIVALLYLAWKKNFGGIQGIVKKSVAQWKDNWKQFTEIVEKSEAKQADAREKGKAAQAAHWKAVGEIIKNAWNNYLNWVVDSNVKILVTIGKFLINTKTTIVNGWNSIVSSVQAALSTMKAAFVTQLALIVMTVIQKFNEIKTNVMTALANVITTVQTKLTDMKNAFIAKFTEAANAAIKFGQDLKYQIGMAISMAVITVQEKMSSFVQAGKDMIGGIITGLTQKASDLYAYISNIVSNAISHLLGTGSLQEKFGVGLVGAHPLSVIPAGMQVPTGQGAFTRTNSSNTTNYFQPLITVVSGSSADPANSMRGYL